MVAVGEVVFDASNALTMEPNAATPDVLTPTTRTL